MLHPPPLPRTLEASLRDLASEKPHTRASSIKDLARHVMGDLALRARALPLFEKALKDEHAGVRGAAAVALADVKAVEALPSLLTAVEDVDGYVRQMALNALGEIGDGRAAGRLERALKDERPEVRYQAIIAFSRVAPAEDIAPALLSATRDDDPAIRYIALRIAEDQLARDLSATLHVRAKAMLEDAAPEVRLVAAIYLAKAGDDAGRGLLLDVVRGRLARRPEAEDEQEAIEVCGALGLTEAIPDLERRAWGLRRFVQTTCVFQAKVALARMGSARAIAEIVSDLDSGDREKRNAAIVAAGRARIGGARTKIEALAADVADPELVREALALLS
jgi:HEAT repeat protein